MKKCVGMVAGFVVGTMVVTGGAATTNRFTAGSGVNWAGPNWDAAPESWADYSANLVFGSVAEDRYNPNNNARQPANLGSMTFTSQATKGYTVTGYAIQMENAPDNNNNIIVNDSSHKVYINPQIVSNWGAAGERFIRASNGDIQFNRVTLWNNSLVFQANAGRTVIVKELTVGGNGVERPVVAEGDSAIGGSIQFDSITDNDNSIRIESRRAALVNLNTSDGLVSGITLRSGQISFSENRTVGTLSFGDALVEDFDNEVLFNGNDIQFDALQILSAAEEKNILDFSGGNSHIMFDDSSSEEWLGELYIRGFKFDEDSLRFGTDANGLTSAQLGSITLIGDEGAPLGLDSNGYLIPEPATLGMFAVFGFAMFVIRKMQGS